MISVILFCIMLFCPELPSQLTSDGYRQIHGRPLLGQMENMDKASTSEERTINYLNPHFS